MAITNEFGLSVKQDLRVTKRGYWAASGKVASSTNAKPVIIINNVGQRDSIVTVTFGGAVTVADLNAGSNSYLELYVNDTVLFGVKVQTLDMGNPFMAEFSLFVPANSSIRVDVTDLDTTGDHTTMVRGYYLD